MAAKDLLEEPRLARDGELRQKLRALYARDQFGMHERVLVFHGGLKAKYSYCHECRLVHLLSGSTVNPPYNHDDLPGEDSVAAFIESEYTRAFGPTA